MKRLGLFPTFICIALIAATGTWALKAQTKPEEKRYKVEQSIEWWSRTLNVLESAKYQLRQSDLPSKNVVFLVDSLLTPIQIEMTRQVQDQLNAEHRKAQSKDSTSTKTKKN